MDLRISGVFNPLARAAGFFLSEMGVSPTGVALSSFIAALLSSILFIFSYRIPFLSIETLLGIAVALIFVNAFLDDVERRIEKKTKKKSIFGGPLGTILGQLSDVFIIFSALIFLSIKDTYYNFGSLFFINLRYVEPGLIGHTALGTIALAGILLLRRLASQKKESGLGLWTRSERMYVLFLFSAAGFYTGLFSGLLFTGIIFLTLFIYISILRRKIKKGAQSRKTHRLSYSVWRLIRRAASSSINLIRWVLRGLLRIIGVLLLGIYLTLEKIYLALINVGEALKKIKMPRAKAGGRTTYKHPPIKPFEGTIAPSPSTLPADSEARASLVEIDETMEEDSKIEEPVTIELPPPTHLMEGDTSYTGEGAVSESLLVEYEPTAKKEDVLIDVVEFMVSEGKDVVIVSTQPATSHYKEMFRDIKGIRVIDLPDQAVVPGRDEIPMTNLEYFSEVFETLSKRHVFIFEPLSNLILHIGVAQAYRFVSQTLSRLSKNDIAFIVFINKSGHDQKDIANFENLFLNIANIEENRLKKVR